MKKIIIPIIACIGVSLQLGAQEKTKYELKGDKQAFVYAYDKAIVSYTHAEPLSLAGKRKLAESYHKMSQFVEEENVYKEIVVSSSGAIAEDYYNYAMVLKSNGKYSESSLWMDRFQQMKPEDLRAKCYVENQPNLSSLMADEGKYKVTHLGVNTDAQDFGTAYYQDKIVFASSRAKPSFIKRKYNGNGKSFLNLYSSELDGVELKDPKNFSKHLNGKMHDGPASFSKNGEFMAFTRNHYHDKSKDKVIELQIFTSTNTNGKWTDPLAFEYNNSSYSTGHPCLSADGKTMYFASNMPGGYGGTDLYITHQNASGGWEKPVNMGNKINTEGDELFPFFEENKSILMFTSNGHFGLGGLDIFMCPMNGTEAGKVTNAGAPLNTRYDDFALITGADMKKGYFSSNRSGGSGDDDVYGIEFLKTVEVPVTIEGIAKDKEGKPVPMTFITLTDSDRNTLDTITTSTNGFFTFVVAPDKSYNLIGKKIDYLEGNNTASTFGDLTLVKADVVLLQDVEEGVEILPEDVVVNNDLGQKLKPIYFDYDKYVIRADAAKELDKIVKVMNKNPNMVVELGAHTDCRGTREYNLFLSDFRAKASLDYIQSRITNPSRISGKGFGESKLLNDCACEDEVISTCSLEEQQLNRRTEFIVIKK